jgi:hypothetical protein
VLIIRTRNCNKNYFPCLYPGVCDEKIFKRPADLERHYRNVHGGPDQKEEFYCDYPPCKRLRGPFTRKDHFRDHLRDYHKEDIGCAKGEKQLDKKKWIKRQEAWIEERKIVADWWRCPKCLHRVHIAESDYKCQICTTTCDQERKDRMDAVRTVEATRQKPTPQAPTTSNSIGLENSKYGYTAAAPVAATTYGANCASCGDFGWIWNEREGTYDGCLCQQLLQQSVCKIDDHWNSGDGNFVNPRY